MAAKNLQNSFKKPFSSLLPIEILNKSMENLDFSPVKGFIKGFIDLVYEDNNQFFIVDWKSNYLGSNVECYNKNEVVNTMVDHNYILQYHIYTIALDLYLKNRGFVIGVGGR